MRSYLRAQEDPRNDCSASDQKIPQENDGLLFWSHNEANKSDTSSHPKSHEVRWKHKARKYRKSYPGGPGGSGSSLGKIQVFQNGRCIRKTNTTLSGGNDATMLSALLKGGAKGTSLQSNAVPAFVGGQSIDDFACNAHTIVARTINNIIIQGPPASNGSCNSLRACNGSCNY